MTTELNSSESGRQIWAQEAFAESSDERRRRWASLLRSRHYEPVISDILSDELPKYTNSRAIDPTDIVTHTRECALILASAPDVFFAAVEGNLVSRMFHDADLQEEYATIQERAHLQPSIYVHLLADEAGQAPSPAQYLTIRDMLEDYLHPGPSSHAHHIDNITAPLVSLSASTKGHRKYLSTPSTPRSPHRVATFHRLTAGITLRCTAIPIPQHHTPLPHPPCEAGYALNAHKRLAQHRSHTSSNPIMNLVQDICTHLFRAKLINQHFTLHQFIIYLIFRPRQAAIAEIFVSALLQTWVEGGGGFNAYPAGRSVASSLRVSGERWRGFEEEVRRGGLVERVRGLRERAEVWRRALEWEDGEVGVVEEEDRDEEMQGVARGQGEEDGS